MVSFEVDVSTSLAIYFQNTTAKSVGLEVLFATESWRRVQSFYSGCHGHRHHAFSSHV